jgi:hypothetical protein
MARNEARSKSQRENNKAIQSTTVVGLLLNHQLSSHSRPLSVTLSVQRLRDSAWEHSTSKTGLANTKPRLTLLEIVSQE